MPKTKLTFPVTDIETIQEEIGLCGFHFFAANAGITTQAKNIEVEWITPHACISFSGCREVTKEDIITLLSAIHIAEARSTKDWLIAITFKIRDIQKILGDVSAEAIYRSLQRLQSMVFRSHSGRGQTISRLIYVVELRKNADILIIMDKDFYNAVKEKLHSITKKEVV